MQKAISEFSYIQDILRQVKDTDLTNEQAMNFLNVLCSEKNPLNIETLDDLNNYNNLANDQLQVLILELKNITGSDYAVEIKRIKEVLCENLLGMGLYDSKERGYGNTIEYIYRLYDISEGETSIGEYSSEEKRLLHIMNFIIKEEFPNNLLDFIKNLEDITSIRNYTAVAKLIEKVQERELSQMNERITTLAKLDEACERVQGSDNPTVYREEIEGVKIYHLNGEPYCMFQHDPGNATLEDLLYYESQAGNTAICTRVVYSTSSDDIDSIKLKEGSYLYGEIPSKGLIGLRNKDAKTTHTAKRTRMHSIIDRKVTELDQIDFSRNEAAMYRRQRDHSRITNDNTGGNIPPMAYCVTIYEDGTTWRGDSLEDLAQRFQGTGIAIIAFHKEAYRDKEQIEEREETTKNQDDDLSR